MRWIQLNYILLASFAILSATKAESSRHKRDLSYVKNFIKTALFGRENKTSPELVLVNNNENYKIFRIPGFNNILVKAVPKVPGAAAVPEKVELISPEDSNIGIVASYLGTKTQGETLNALEGVTALLGSGVLTASKDQAVPIGPHPPHLQLIAEGEGTFEKPHILLDTSTICDEVQAEEKPNVVQQSTIWQGHPFLSIFQRPIPFPTILKPVVPVNVPIPALPTKYSYKQIHEDGKVTTYTANNDHNVIVAQSNPLPPVVTYRIQEVMNMGVHGSHGLASIPAGNIQRPLVQYFTSPKVNPYRPVVSSAGHNYSYKQIHNDGTLSSYTSGQKGRDVVVTEGAKVPAIPSFITDRIEKVSTIAASGKPPNPVLLSGLEVAQTQWYKPVVIGHQMVDNNEGVQVNVDTKEQQHIQNVNTGSQYTFSYQTIHRDGNVTNHKAKSLVSVKPAKVETRPIYPLFIEDRLQTIAKTSGGSFSYKIIHNDGSVTNYGGFGVHEGKSGSHIVPDLKIKPVINQQANFISTNKGQAFQPEMEEKGSGYSYKRIHSDGTVTTYSSNGVIEEHGTRPVNQFQADDIQMTNNGNLHTNLNKQQNVGILLHDTQQKNDRQTSSAGKHAKNQHVADDIKSNKFSFYQNNLQAPQIGNSSPGSFSYKAVHSDGSMTIYSPNGVKEENIQLNNANQPLSSAAIFNKPENIQNVQFNAQNNTLNNQKEKQNIHVIAQSNVGSNLGSFSYKTIRSDGSNTLYLQNGVKEENATIIYKNQQASVAKDLNHQNVHVNAQKVVIPVSGSLSYKNIRGDDSAMIYSQNGIKEDKKENQKLSSIEGGNQDSNEYFQASAQNYAGLALSEQKMKQNIQKHAHSSAPGSFSYKTVHNDGSTTIYSQNGIKEEDVPLKYRNLQSLIVAGDKQQRNNQNILMSAQNIVVPVAGSFSYKVVNNDGSMTTYTQNGVIQKTKAKESHVEGNTEHINKAQQFGNDVKINMNEHNLHTNQQNKGTSSQSSFLYKAVHRDGSETNYSGQGVDEIKYSNHNNPNYSQSQQHSSIKKYEVTEKNYVHTNPQYKNKPYGSFSYKRIHSDGSVSSMQSGISQQNVQNQDQLLSKDLKKAEENNVQKSNQIVPPAPQLPKVSNNDFSVTPVSVLIADSNKVLFTKPVESSYTYKQINHNSPDQFKVAVNIGDAATKEVQVAAGVNINDAATVDTIPNDYVYIPPANVNEPPPIKPLVTKEETSEIKQNVSVVVLAPVEEVPCVEKCLSEHPIVVLDKPMQYSYEQRKTDGSAIHVESDQSVVSVNIPPKEGGNRGDIPESP